MNEQNNVNGFNNQNGLNNNQNNFYNQNNGNSFNNQNAFYNNNFNNNQNQFTSSMNDDAFNAFNQNAQIFQQQQAERRALEEQMRKEQQAAPSTEEIQKKAEEDEAQAQKEKYSLFSSKKKVEEDKKIDINNIDSLPTFHTKKKEKKELTDEEKKKQSIILLVVLLIVLVVVIIFTYRTFISIYSPAPNNNISYSAKIADKNVNNIEKNENLIDSYDCKKSFNKVENYNLPYQELIDINTFSYITSYINKDYKVSSVSEKITIKYNTLTPEQIEGVNKFCNSYNSINDSYQLTCEFTNNNLVFLNNFDLKKMDSSSVIQNEIKIDLIPNKDTKMNKVIEAEKKNGNTCEIMKSLG